MSRYILACPDHRLAALDASGVRSLHPASLRRGACGLLRCVPLEVADTVPAEISACPLCAVVPLGGPGGWAERQHTGRWVERIDPALDTAWTGTERGCLIPEADATEAHAVSAGGLAYCPRVEVEGVVHRLVRYTDRVAPDALSTFTQLTAEEVTVLAATEVRNGLQL